MFRCPVGAIRALCHRESCHFLDVKANRNHVILQLAGGVAYPALFPQKCAHDARCGTAHAGHLWTAAAGVIAHTHGFGVGALEQSKAADIQCASLQGKT